MTWDPKRFASFDCETHLITPGLLAPPLVCASVAADYRDGIKGQLLSKEVARAAFRDLLQSDWTIVGANIAYDMLVMAVDAAKRGEDLIGAIFAKYDRGEVYDVQIAEALHAIAGGHLGKNQDGSPLRDAKGKVTDRYSLDTCVRLVLGRDNAKANDQWRLRYHELEHLPISEWPDTAKIYPVDDAVNTLEVALAQVGRNRNLHDLAAQCRAAWALHLGASWGFRVDGAALDKLEARVLEAREKGAPRFVELGLIEWDDKKRKFCQDLKRTKYLVARAYGATRPCTACGGKCAACGGGGGVAFKVAGARAGTTKTCPACKGEGWPACDPCHGTGLAITPQVPRTDKEGIGYGRDALTESGDEDLMAFAEWSEDAKIANVYAPKLREGVDAPWNLRPNSLLANGRASYSGIIQLMPREGGVRECIVPRPGRVFVSCDYSGLELATHAQSCLWLLGYSELAKALNSGVKVHDAMGARLGGITYEEILARSKAGDKKAKSLRQAAKAANFGFPGGMGAPRLVLAKRKKSEGTTTAPDGTVYNGIRFCILLRGAARCGLEKVTEWKDRPMPPTCRACIECAEELRAAWFQQWPENRDYFDRAVGPASDRGWVEQHVSKRIRGGLTFSDTANTWFSALAADGAKLALYRVSRECYTDRSSPLYGSRPILFSHDEIVAELLEDRAHEAAHRLSEVMVSSMREYTPDVVIAAPPAIMLRMYKAAEPVYHGGRLVPWEPDHDEKTCAECQVRKAA